MLSFSIGLLNAYTSEQTRKIRIILKQQRQETRRANSLLLLSLSFDLAASTCQRTALERNEQNRYQLKRQGQETEAIQHLPSSISLIFLFRSLRAFKFLRKISSMFEKESDQTDLPFRLFFWSFGQESTDIFTHEIGHILLVAGFGRP
jgi:hypothetical protein